MSAQKHYQSRVFQEYACQTEYSRNEGCFWSWWEQAHGYSNLLPLLPCILEMVTRKKLCYLLQSTHYMHNPRHFNHNFLCFPWDLFWRTGSRRFPTFNPHQGWFLYSRKVSRILFLRTWALNNFQHKDGLFYHVLINNILLTLFAMISHLFLGICLKA